jgi:hypothetical protein
MFHMKKGVIGILLLLVQVSVSLAGEITVFCDRPVGTIKAKLAGVAQGGSTNSYLKADVVKAIRGLGIKFVRLEAVTWNGQHPVYDPATKRYDWTALDREIEAIQSSGAEIVADLFYMPQWLSSDAEGKRGAWYYAGTRDEEGWAEHVRQIVKHVNIDRKYKIKYWEVWNEPSGAYFFTDWKLGKDRFWRLYEVTAKAVKGADPAALVGGFADNLYYLNAYKEFFEYARPRKVPIDFLTVHWYGEWLADGWKKPQLYQELTQAVQRLYFKYFQKNVPIFFTEWNLNAEAGGYSAVQQAAFMGSAYYWLQESPAAGAAFFRVEDYKGINRYLLDSGLQMRAPARILKMFSTLPERRVRVENSIKDVTVLAAGNGKRIVVMISRYDFSTPGSKVSVRLNFPGCQGPGKITTYVEDAGSAEKPGDLVPRSQVDVKKGPVSVTIPLDNYAVALVVIDRF